MGMFTKNTGDFKEDQAKKTVKPTQRIDSRQQKLIQITHRADCHILVGRTSVIFSFGYEYPQFEGQNSIDLALLRCAQCVSGLRPDVVCI